MSSGGTSAAASSSTKKTVRLRPLAPAAGTLVVARAREGEAERGRLVGAGEHQPDALRAS